MPESRGKRPRSAPTAPATGLTSTQLRATPLDVEPAYGPEGAWHVIVDDMPPVSVSVASSGGGLTDTELRAAPLAITISDAIQPAGSDSALHAVSVQGLADQIPLGVLGPLTDSELRASRVPVDVVFPTIQPVSGGVVVTNFPASQAVTGPLTDAQIRASAITVTGPLNDAQLRAAAVPVSGPLTDAQLRALGVPVTGTFWQATQPVSGPLTDVQLRASAVPVSGAFFQATQPVSAAALPLPAGASTEATLAALSAKLPASVGQKAMAAALAVVLASDQSAIPTTKVPTGGTNVLKTGSLTTVAVTVDQVVLTYTVTAGKTFYLCYLVMYGRLTAVSATASIIGAISLESPAGTKLITFDDVNPTTSEPDFHPLMFGEPIPIAAGTVIRIVVTPAAATSMLWRGNFGGYEK